MLFSSITFLFYFLPIVMLIYLVVPRCLKNSVILIASLFFYAWGEPRYVFLMIATIVLGYLFGLLIEKCTQKKGKKLLISLSVIFSLGVLGLFKYADFFIDNFNRISGKQVSALHLALPVGISFYTFQVLSYLIDVYRGDAKAQRNFISLATYISMFPQLIAGPIVRYTDIEEQLTHRTHSIEKISYGIRRFCMGLSKKVLLANALGEICVAYKESGEQTVLFAWLYAIAISLQIYFDFSGYSDMAIGLGSIFGFDFPENFKHPFTSKSITEFWRRWHITLGSWFRDYLYIPMGGNRVSKLRFCFNLFVVWAATGLWHGANWNFVFWGLYFAVLLILEKIFLGPILKKMKGFSHVYLVFLILISFLIFDANSMGEIFHNIGGLFGLTGQGFTSVEASFLLRDYAGILIVSIIGATRLPVFLVNKFSENQLGRKTRNALEPLYLSALLILSIASLVNGSFNPFLYFRF